MSLPAAFEHQDLSSVGVVSADGGGGAVGTWGYRGAGESEMKRSSLARAGMGTDRYLNKPS